MEPQPPQHGHRRVILPYIVPPFLYNPAIQQPQQPRAQPQAQVQPQQHVRVFTWVLGGASQQAQVEEEGPVPMEIDPPAEDEDESKKEDNTKAQRMKAVAPRVKNT